MYTPYKDDVSDYKKHPEKYYSVMQGIDKEEFEHLNESLIQTGRSGTFESGKICIIYGPGMDLFGQIDKKARVKFYLSENKKQKVPAKNCRHDRTTVIMAELQERHQLLLSVNHL